MTWKELKLITLQKMFSAEGSSIPNDEATRDYLAGMPAAANEALNMICTAGKYVLSKVEIAHYPSKNLLGDYGKFIHGLTDGKVSFESDGAHAFYVEFYGNGELSVTVNGFEVTNMPVISEKLFTAYSGKIENPENGKVVVTITSSYKGAIKNACLYEECYFPDEEVLPDAPRIPYDMLKLVDDFYSFDPRNIYYEGDLLTEQYIRSHNLFDESGHIVLLPNDMPGNYSIGYRAYPDVITTITEDDHELKVAPEVAAILPLYMASQLYKEDDNGIATSYRNEFEVAFERLQSPAVLSSSEKFTSESGWI